MPQSRHNPSSSNDLIPNLLLPNESFCIDAIVFRRNVSINSQKLASVPGDPSACCGSGELLNCDEELRFHSGVGIRQNWWEIDGPKVISRDYEAPNGLGT